MPANYEATRYDFDGAFLTGIQGVNTGIVVPWGSASIPSGFLECNGQAVSRSTYAALFAVVGTTYGAGDTTTTFNVPDLTDRTVLSRSNNKALASTMGANTVAKTGTIGGSSGNTSLSNAEIPSHAHSGAYGAGGQSNPGNPCAGGQGGTGTSSGTSGSAGQGQAHGHNLSATFVGDATSVLQPYLTLIYIIKT